MYRLLTHPDAYDAIHGATAEGDFLRFLPEGFATAARLTAIRRVRMYFLRFQFMARRHHMCCSPRLVCAHALTRTMSLLN